MAGTDTALEILRSLAPGTPLRDGIELVLAQGTGGLIVLGHNSKIESMSTGGFHLDGADFSPARLAELAKMDGAIVTDESAEVIYRANIHLIPDPTIETSETGTRHRTAERVARQTGQTVIVVSEGRSTATVYRGDLKYELRSPTTLLGQANQSLHTLERFRRRLEDTEERLTRVEVDDIATNRDAVLALQRAALVQKIALDLETYAVELGGEGDLIRVQLNDLRSGVTRLANLVHRDYAKTYPPEIERPLANLAEMPSESLADPQRVATRLNLSPIDAHARPRGYRILERVPRLPDSVKDSLVDHFGGLQKMLQSSVTDLDQVDGVGRARAQQLRAYFDRLLDTAHAWELDED